MKKSSSAKLLILFSLIGIFYNILIVIGFIPYEYAWWWRLESYEQMLKFEFVWFLVNLFIIWVVAMKAGFVKQILPSKIIFFILWIFVLMFAWNTLGNLFALSLFEKLVFTPMTLFSSYLFFKLATIKD